MPNEPELYPSKKNKFKPDAEMPGQKDTQALPNVPPSSLSPELEKAIVKLPYPLLRPQPPSQPQNLTPPSQTSLQNSAQVQQPQPAKPRWTGRKPRRGHIDARPKDAQGNLIPAWGKKGLISESRLGKTGSGLAGFYAMNPNARRGLDLRLGQRAEAAPNAAPSARPRPAPLAPGTPQQQMDAKNGIVARTEDRTVFDTGAEVTKKVDGTQTQKTLTSPYGSGSSTVTRPAQPSASQPVSKPQPTAIKPPQKPGAIYTQSFAMKQPGAASAVNDQLKRKQQMT